MNVSSCPSSGDWRCRHVPCGEWHDEGVVVVVVIVVVCLVGGIRGRMT